MIARFSTLLILAFWQLSFSTLLLGCPFQEKSNLSDDELKLEDLYPEKSLFGPSASSPEFSADGRYAAFLYRPYEKRRHGNDLWLYDFESGELKTITSVSMMSQFQRSARRVRQDRLDKHNKANKKKAEKEKANKKKDSKNADNQDNSEQEKEDDKKDQEQNEKEIVESVSDKDGGR